MLGRRPWVGEELVRAETWWHGAHLLVQPATGLRNCSVQLLVEGVQRPLTWGGGRP